MYQRYIVDEFDGFFVLDRYSRGVERTHRSVLMPASERGRVVKMKPSASERVAAASERSEVSDAFCQSCLCAAIASLLCRLYYMLRRQRKRSAESGV